MNLKSEILQVFDYDLQRQLVPYMKDMKPLPGIYDPNFIAANQAARADNLITGTKAEQMAVVRDQLKHFKNDNGLDEIIVLWTANTERYSEIKQGLNDTEGVLLKPDYCHACHSKEVEEDVMTCVYKAEPASSSGLILSSNVSYCHGDCFPQSCCRKRYGGAGA